ncbi:regulator of Ty1 Transposition [Marasmius crinis-equi]|uniref:Regulator of Ty1 Transposition n=1 Tax=Marasmius crinis-equi TaxID=585013 RepID=A0ABR3FUG8_9AGAR
MLFDNIRYFLSDSIPADNQDELIDELNGKGAKRVKSLSSCTHVITNSAAFEGYQEVGENVKVVSGLGGQWRSQYTKDVTHLFTLREDSQTYQNAMSFREQTGVKIVAPHWFDDSVKLGVRDLDVSAYEWPDPRVLKRNEKQKQDASKKAKSLNPEREALLKTAAWSEDSDIPVTTQKAVYGGRRVLLSTTLELGDRRVAVEAGIKRAGGKVVKLKSTEDEVDKIDDCDIFITRFRNGAAYFKACSPTFVLGLSTDIFCKAVRARKTVGTLQWLFHVQLTGVLSRPLDQLLHYPHPSKPIENFTDHEITITNYTGEARDYLKKLIAVMGADFTPTMSPRNTVLVAAEVQNGAKADRAYAWSIPVVNHLWLEDCFVQWRNLTVGVEKYIVHPKGLDFYSCLGKRGVSQAVEDLEEIVKAEIEEQEAAAELLGNGGQGGMPLGTASSARDIREVAEQIAPGPMDLDDGPDDFNNHDMEVDAPMTPRRSPKKQVAKSPSKKPPNSVSRTRRKGDVEEDPADDEDDVGTRAAARTRDSIRSPVKNEAAATRSKKSRKDAEDNVAIEAERGKENRNERAGTGKASTSAAKPKSKRAVRIASDNDSDSDNVPHTPPRKKSSRKKKVQDVETEVDDPAFSDSTLTPVKSPAKRTHNRNGEGPSRHAASLSPTKSAVSVVVPTLEAVNLSPNRSVAKTNSVHVAAKEERVSSSSRTRTSRVAPAASSASPPSSSAVETSRARRSAAAVAEQRLHNSIVPDLNSFQQQMKNSKSKGGRKSLGAFSSVDEPGGTLPPSSHRRASTIHPEDEGESEIEPPSTAGKKGKGKAEPNGVKSSIKPKKGRKSTVDDEVEEAEVTSRAAKRKSVGSRKDAEEDLEDTEAESSSRQQKKRKVEPEEEVRMMTTQVNLRDDVTKVLVKLGVKTASKPWDCTHLLVKSLVRTEKFLCAVAVGAHILSEKWAVDCASTKKILPEDKYILRDPEGEAKYDMDLKESLRRARRGREQSNRLLERHIFYVTHKVPAEFKMLKNVIIACGGTLVSQTPTPRIIDANPELRHVISCPEDANIWRPLVQKGYKVYTQELILTGVLRQEIEWDNTKWMVEGSF